MGGRGKSLRAGFAQMTIEQYKGYLEIQKIVKESEVVRAKGEKDLQDIGTVPLKKCVCCEDYTIPVDKENVLCYVCGWIDDAYQNMYPECKRGRNKMCLNDVKRGWRKRKKARMKDAKNDNRRK